MLFLLDTMLLFSNRPLNCIFFNRQLRQQNEELLRKLTHSTKRLEIMEADFDSSRHYLEAELNHARDEVDKLKDKFRRSVTEMVAFCGV